MEVSANDDLQRELNQAEPNVEILKKLGGAVGKVTNYLNEQNPEVVVLSGKSAELSKTLLESSGVVKKIVVLPPEGVHSLYEASAFGEENKDTSPFSDYVKPGSKIAIVDDFVKTGEKAKAMLGGLKNLGYPDTSFATFAGYPGRKYHRGIFIAESDAGLADYLSNLANLTSVSKKSDEELPKGSYYASQQSDIKVVVARVLSKIRAILPEELLQVPKLPSKEPIPSGKLKI